MKPVPVSRPDQEMNQNPNRLLHVFMLSVSLAFLGCQSPVPSPPANQPQDQQQTEQSAKTYDNAAMLDPSKATETAPEKYQVKFVTTKGDIVVEVTRAWSPNGADRFYNLVKIGYFDDVVIFRAVKDFMVQSGIVSKVDKKLHTAAVRQAGFGKRDHALGI